MVGLTKRRAVPKLTGKNAGTSPYAPLIPVQQTPKARAREIVTEKVPAKSFAAPNRLQVELKKPRK